MRQKAFTIVEVAIAAAVVAVLSVMAIPRLNEVVDRQEFTQSVQSMSSCLQEAQTRAASPARLDYSDAATSATGVARWVAAEISTVANVTTCKVIGISSDSERASLLASSPSTNLFTNAPVFTSSKAMSIPDQRLYFGSLEGGSLQRKVVGATITDATSKAGLSLALQIISVSRTDLSNTVVVPFSGSPITITAP